MRLGRVIAVPTLEREVVYVVAATFSCSGYDSICNIRVTAAPSQLDDTCSNKTWILE